MINDFVKIVDLSFVTNLAFVQNIKAAIPLADDMKHYVLCGAVALVDLVIFLIVAALRSRMRTYIFEDTMVYIPAFRPRRRTRARTFVGVYQALELSPSGFFLFAWIRKIRRAIRGYRDIVITCPGSQTDGTIILRSVGNWNKVLSALNGRLVSESTNIAYSNPTTPSTQP